MRPDLLREGVGGSIACSAPDGVPDPPPPVSSFSVWARQFEEASATQRAAWEADDESLTEEQAKARWKRQTSIHLLDAYVLSGSGIRIPQQRQPMRVQLASVDAWGLGLLAISDPSAS